MRKDLPVGTVTFLFTDIEGSTTLMRELGAEGYESALMHHRRALRSAFALYGGVEVDTQGDALFFAFPTAPGAVKAAAQGQERLEAERVRVRMGLHTGVARLSEEGYVGEDVHLGARIATAGHGGQVLLSRATRELVDEEVGDLGEHRLKDFAEPVWLYQLGTARFPPLKTISNTNLPRPASSFVGREREVDDLVALLNDGARLVTLTGPGGSGKTRLAIEAATQLVPNFRNGTFWVGLAAVRDPDLVTLGVGKTIGARGDLADHIGEREMLLVLDNMEQVVEAAAGLAALVESCPNLRVVVTSREVLRVRGEVEFPVRPLGDREATELFYNRSRIGPDPAVSELCRRLDNLPLAIELAAARAGVISPRQILERLAERLDLLRGGRDADARQRTLRATIQWSYDLLSPEEKRLYARLSVFSGGWSLGAAEVVAAADLDTLQSLLDRSLIRHEDERFSMLETIRDFAAERLEDSGESDSVRGTHADYFAALAHEAEPSILGLSPEEWLDRLDRDHDNLRTALDWLASSGDYEQALNLAGSIWEFWCLRGHQAEGWRRIDQLLAHDQRPTLARAKALSGAQHLATGAGMDPAVRVMRAEEALALHRRVGDPWGAAFAEFELGGSLALAGNFATARPLVEPAIERFRELGDEHRALQAMRIAAWCAESLGDPERARSLREEILRGARAAGDRQMEARALAELGRFASEADRHQDALLLLTDAFRMDREYGDPYEMGSDLIYMGRALGRAGKPELAAQLLALSEAWTEERVISYPSYLSAWWEEATEKARTQLSHRAFSEAWAEGQKLTLDQAAELALSSKAEPSP